LKLSFDFCLRGNDKFMDLLKQNAIDFWRR
jgi:hypothetical protein